MNSRSRVGLMTVLVGGCLASLLGGCRSGNDNAVSDRAIRHDLTPELWTLHQRKVDMKSSIYHTWNTNLRQMHTDIARATYNDRPTRLSHTPVPH